MIICPTTPTPPARPDSLRCSLCGGAPQGHTVSSDAPDHLTGGAQ